MSNAVEITDANFKTEVMESQMPVLLDFWAAWCGPCKMIAPLIEELVLDFKGRAKIGKVDVDKNQALAQQYGVRSIPTLLVVKDGAVVAQRVGAADRSEIVKMLQEAGA